MSVTSGSYERIDKAMHRAGGRGAPDYENHKRGKTQPEDCPCSVHHGIRDVV
jgi:hypothetical protein